MPRPRLSAITLARIRTLNAAGIAWPADLRADVERCLEGQADDAAQRKLRDELIRRAALLLPPAASFGRAGMLAQEAKALARTWRTRGAQRAPDTPATPRECLHAAAQLAELPRSQRQFYRVLTGPQH